ncbi:MAG: hypothetical protein AB7S92_21640 [Parvibaculaceae bacterium]
MNDRKQPLPEIKEISVRCADADSNNIVLTVKNVSEPEYQAAIGSADAGNLVASLITTVGQVLDTKKSATRRAELAPTRVFIAGAGIGFGDTAAGPVLVAQTGGLALIFSVTRRDLFDMARQILEDLHTIEDIGGPPRHH